MSIANNKQDFEFAAVIAREYGDSVGQLYLVQSYAIKRDCSERGELFDRERFNTAFRMMVEIVDCQGSF